MLVRGLLMSDFQFLIFFQFVDFASFFLRRASCASVAVFDFICVDEFYSLVFFFRRQVSINIFDLFWRDATVTATANEGYIFVNWTEDGEVVSAESEYSFVITEDMELVANFVEVEGVVEQYAQTLSLYPNPTIVNHPISLGMIYDKVEVYNSIGVRIADYSNVDSIDGMEAAGIYIIRVVNDKDVKFSRIVVR